MRKLLIGACAGLAAGFVMNQFARAVSEFTGGVEGDRAAPGSRRLGRGAQPPQATRHADQDATVRVGTAAYAVVTGRKPRPDDQLRLGTSAHYAFSASLGITYALLCDHLPSIQAGRGALYGGAVWAVADEGIIPALGLSRGPREIGRGVLLFGLTAHFVYGLSLDAAYRRLRA